MLEVARLPGPFGVEIHGADIGGTYEPGLVRELTDILYEHRFLVLRDQKLTKDNFVRFGREWGDPILHLADHLRMKGHPELMELGNLSEERKRDEVRNGSVLWHTDNAFEQFPASATMLYSLQTPKVGGETMYADMVAAYDALPDRMKDRLEGLNAIHSYGANIVMTEGEREASPLTEEQKKIAKSVVHPIVLAHPVTRRRALYAPSGSAYAIENMNDGESLELLITLKKHAVDRRFRMEHRYRVNDLVLWDTFSTIHSAKPIGFSVGEDDRRLLWRISVRGLPLALRAAAA